MLACALLLSPLGASSQGTLQFDFLFDNVFSGTTPPGASPWATEQFQDISPGTVLVTIWNNGTASGNFIGDLYLNLNTSLDPSALVFTLTAGSPGLTAQSISTGANQFKADGDGYYDIQLSFSSGSSGRFAPGDFLSYQVGGIPGLSSQDFDYTSASSTAALLAAAHLIGSGGSSSWLNPSQVTQLPEPGSVSLCPLLLAIVWVQTLKITTRRKALPSSTS